MDESNILNILQFPINTPVKINPIPTNTPDNIKPRANPYGIVVGYATNELNEIIILVQLIRGIYDKPIVEHYHPTYLAKLAVE